MAMGFKSFYIFRDIGTGVDLGFYYANYHSKIPYIQMMGKSGVLGGDIIGAFTHIFHDYAGVIGGAGIDAAVNTASASSRRVCSQVF